MSTFTTATRHKANKEHHCTNCQRQIDPGETYLRQRGYDGGDAWTFKQCAHCEKVTGLYDPRDMDGNISWDGHDSWIEDAARDLAELRAMAGWRNRWRTQSGNLWPLPERANSEGEK